MLASFVLMLKVLFVISPSMSNFAPPVMHWNGWGEGINQEEKSKKCPRSKALFLRYSISPHHRITTVALQSIIIINDHQWSSSMQLRARLLTATIHNHGTNKQTNKQCQCTYLAPPTGTSAPSSCPCLSPCCQSAKLFLTEALEASSW